MPLNPQEVFELHIRCVEGKNLKQVISGTLSPYVVLSGNLIGDADGRIQTPALDSAGTSPQWNHKVRQPARRRALGAADPRAHRRRSPHPPHPTAPPPAVHGAGARGRAADAHHCHQVLYG
jgi:hypothetical protein